MDKFMQILTIVPLVSMMASDYRCRKVSAYQMLLFILSTICFAVTSLGLKYCLINVASNLIIMIIMFVFVTLYFKVRTGSCASVLGSLGLGDVLFFIALVPLYSMIEYLWLLIVVSLFSLSFWIIGGYGNKRTDTIPLITTAGMVYIIYSLFELMP